MARESGSPLQMNSSSPSAENLITSSGAESNSDPITCRNCCSDGRNCASYTNTFTSMCPSSTCSSSSSTCIDKTCSAPNPPPYGGARYDAPSPVCYGSPQPPPLVLHYGVPYPGQPSYYPSLPPYYNIIYDAPPSQKKHKNCILHRLVTTITLLIICISIITLSLDLIYKPKYPSVSLTSATVYSLGAAASNGTVSSDFSLTFAIANPNQHMDIFYHAIDVSVFFGLDTITSNHQPEFFQDSRANTSSVARLIDVDRAVAASTIKGINDDLANGGVVKFRVRMDAAMKFNGMKLFQRLLWAECPDLSIQFVNGTARGGKMVGPSISCNVDD